MAYIATDAGDTVEQRRDVYRDDPQSLLRVDSTAAAHIQEQLTAFYQEQLASTKMDGYVIGLSGGIDSTLVAHLLVDAVGADNVYGIILPAAHTRQQDIDDATTVAEELGITTNNPEQFRKRIEDVVKTLEALGMPADDEQVQQVKRGNILARCRMIVIRDIAKARSALVAGTTNASECKLGYLTLAADGKGGIDNEALYDLYKTTERDLARHMGIPDRIIDKAPTADLWPDQTDRDELAYSYKMLDQVLLGLELELNAREIVDAVGEVDEADVEDIKQRVTANRFKQEPVPYPQF